METKKYFYNFNNSNHGPVSLPELQALAKQGEINASTPVIEEGAKQWKHYRDFEHSDSPAISVQESAQPTTYKLLSINERIDHIITSAFKLPAFFPQEHDKQERSLSSLANILGLVVWLGVILLCIGFTASPLGKQLSVPLMILAGLIIGGVVQYIFYLFYKMTSSLLIGQKILLSSLAYPRLMGAFFIMIALCPLVLVFTTSGALPILLSLCLLILSVTIIYLCLNADKITVQISPEQVSPGREINNILRFAIRTTCLALHLLAPLIILLISLALMGSMSGDGAVSTMLSPQQSTLFMAGMFLIALPVINFFILCLSSWWLDLFDCIFSLGNHQQK